MTFALIDNIIYLILKSKSRCKHCYKKIITHVSWYFYINAFHSNGDFWRYWDFFSGWSDRKIIAKWTITNGIL